MAKRLPIRDFARHGTVNDNAAFFTNPTHAKPFVGNVVIGRLFENPAYAALADFGVMLTPETVAAGGAAFAWFMALGGLAIAHDYAMGGLAKADEVIVPGSGGEALLLMRYAASILGEVVRAGAVVLLFVLIARALRSNERVKRRGPH